MQVVAWSQWWFHSKTSALQEAATETGGCSGPLTSCGLRTIGLTKKKTLCRLRPHGGHIACIEMVRHHYCNSLMVSSYSQNWFDTTAWGSIYGIYKLVQNLIKPTHFALEFYEALLGLLNPVDKEISLDLQFHLEDFGIYDDSLFFENNKVLHFHTLQTMYLSVSLPSHLFSLTHF